MRSSLTYKLNVTVVGVSSLIATTRHAACGPPSPPPSSLLSSFLPSFLPFVDYRLVFIHLGIQNVNGDAPGGLVAPS